MFVKGFGEHIIDILTINPELSSVQTASSILDVSNYTFQALSFGKDAEGFKYHAHTIHSEDSGVYNDGKLHIVVYNSTSLSSYHSSATKTNFSSTYSSEPNYPHYYDTRLERNSTLTNVSSAGELGHYLNPAVMQEIGDTPLWNVVGGFPPSTVTQYVMYNPTGGLITSGSLPASFFNSHGIMDASGFLKFIDADSNFVSALKVSIPGPGGIWVSGAFVTASGISTGQVEVAFTLHTADLASLAAFGGLNHVGVWCLDLKQMLASGLVPPYEWDPKDNIRKYKLVAKKTFLNDLLYHQDNGPLPGFNYYLVNADSSISLVNEGPEYIFNIKFT